MEKLDGGLERWEERGELSHNGVGDWWGEGGVWVSSEEGLEGGRRRRKGELWLRDV